MRKVKFLILLKWGILLGIAVALIQFVKAIGQDLEYLSVGPIIDFLLVITMIGGLFLGVREYRDKYLAGNVTFGKSFLFGSIITLIAFCIVFLYLFLHYAFIDKKGLNSLNDKNNVRYIEKIEQDTILHAEKMLFLSSVRTTLNHQKLEFLDDSSSCSQNLSRLIDTVYNIYYIRLTNENSVDTSIRKLSTFPQNASRILMELTSSVNNNANPEFEGCMSIFNQIIQNTVASIQQEDLVTARYIAEKENIPHYTNPLAAALFFSLSVIIYGLFFNVFVSLYLYRSKPLPGSEGNTDNETNTNDTEETENKSNEE